jgi:hypothetical protein
VFSWIVQVHPSWVNLCYVCSLCLSSLGPYLSRVWKRIIKKLVVLVEMESCQIAVSYYTSDFCSNVVWLVSLKKMMNCTLTREYLYISHTLTCNQFKKPGWWVNRTCNPLIWLFDWRFSFSNCFKSWLYMGHNLFYKIKGW